MSGNPTSWFSHAARLRAIMQGPWTLFRRPIPTPGSENLAFATWAIPYQSPIDYAIPNHRTFQFQEPLVVSNHLTGLVGPGGYEVTYPYTSTPLTQIAPTANPAEVITIYG